MATLAIRRRRISSPPAPRSHRSLVRRPSDSIADQVGTALRASIAFDGDWRALKASSYLRFPDTLPFHWNHRAVQRLSTAVFDYAIFQMHQDTYSAAFAGVGSETASLRDVVHACMMRAIPGSTQTLALCGRNVWLCWSGTRRANPSSSFCMGLAHASLAISPPSRCRRSRVFHPGS